MGLLSGMDHWVSLLTELVVTQTWCNDYELEDLQKVLVHGDDRQVLGGDYGANLDKLKSIFFPFSNSVSLSLSNTGSLCTHAPSLTSFLPTPSYPSPLLCHEADHK